MTNEDRKTVKGINILILPYKNTVEYIYLEVIKYGVKALMITGDKMLSCYDVTEDKGDFETSENDLSFLIDG